MTYYTNLFSPDTYETFSNSDRSVSGFRERHRGIANRLKVNDKLICYLTKFSRWIGILQITEPAYEDSTPIFAEHDPFIVRFKVKPLVWLDRNKTIPIHADLLWNTLSFTRDLPKDSIAWTGKMRGSLTRLDDQDGNFLEDMLIKQSTNGQTYPLDEKRFAQFAAQTIKRSDREIEVSVPQDKEEPKAASPLEIRESIKVQALLARIGAHMGFNIWLPRNDKVAVTKELAMADAKILDSLPLNYDPITLKTIEQIDVLWLKSRFIVRAFEVEHTTSIYSGILRMADLIALQPNMSIKLHIVAPSERRNKVIQEISRPVFSLLEPRALAEICSYLSYEDINDIAQLKHLSYLSDTVLDEYAEFASEAL